MALSIWHWIILALLLLPMIPIAHMLRRIGLSPWLVLLYVIPVVGYVALWVVAYARWPKLDEARP